MLLKLNVLFHPTFSVFQAENDLYRLHLDGWLVGSAEDRWTLYMPALTI